MASLLVRDLNESTKKALAVRAAQNGRSQQAEARAILEEALQSQSESWIEMILDGAAEVGGIDIQPPQRHVPRITGILM